MRRTFSDYIEKWAANDPSLVFITGDLGFNAFEKLRQILGTRFINAGVAEQSMVSMAAGMASQGHKVIVYSIAPFLVYRALEQIRNDICFHKMPVLLVGNGGGYGYGIMGSSHHALSDIATLSSLPDLSCYVPPFKEFIPLTIKHIFDQNQPAYLRLGTSISAGFQFNNYDPIIRLHANPDSDLTIVASGPVIANLIQNPDFQRNIKKVDVFLVNQFPILNLSADLILSLKKTTKLLVFEEHVAVGGLGSQLSVALLKNQISLKAFQHRFAVNYPDNLYGSQDFHQKQSGLDSISLLKDIDVLLKKIS